MARINLLPWRELERARKQREFITGLAGTAILSGFMVLGAHMFMQGRIADQESRNQYLQSEIVAMEKKIVEIKDLEKTKARLLARMDVIQQLQGSRPEVVHLFDELARTVPAGVYVNSLQRKATGVSVSGTAQSNARVSAYMRRLDGSPWLTNPKLSVIESSKKARSRTSRFKLSVQQQKPKPATDKAPTGASS